MRRRLLLLVPAVVAALLLAPLAYLWWASLLPDDYSVMDMGYVDAGGGHAAPAHGSAGMAGMPGMGGTGGSGHGGASPREITDLVAPDGPADVTVDLTASRGEVELGDGRSIDGFLLDGTSPGPTIEARAGQLVEVRLHNEDVEDGVTLHWHGVDVPNAMDGVAGVTQDAVMPGEDFTYRFVADQVGTYWYHSHQVSHEQVRDGLFGLLVVLPARSGPGPADGTADGELPSGDDALAATDVDLPVAVHTYDGVKTLNGNPDETLVDAEVGDVVRVRLVDTDNGPMPVWVTGGAFRVSAVDGYDVHEPPEVSGRSVLLTAGGRVDLTLEVPPGGVRVETSNASLAIGPDGAPPATSSPTEQVDLLSYGEPADVGFDADDPDRKFEYSIGRRPGFLDGRPGLWWSINGHLYPDVPMFEVSEGDVVVFHIENHSGDVHPMHLHGHHAVVLARNGVDATGSPWWVDSLDVANGDSYDIAFVADNPGIWMDHCHNLPHAAQGLVAHLMYQGWTTPFSIGDAGNHPE